MAIERIYVCEAGWEEVLAEELSRVFPGSDNQILSPGWVTSEISSADAAMTPAIAFAWQTLPNPVPLAAPSISAAATAAGNAIIEQMRQHDGPWRMHVFRMTGPGLLNTGGRAKLIAAGILAHLRKKQRRLMRTLVSDAATSWTADEALVQVGLRTPESGFVSYCSPTERHLLRRCVSRFEGGIVSIPPDRRPPSRAFAKLLEAELRMERSIGPGEYCVDLGASPGGWTFIALERGANVVAVDREPLRPDLMQHANLTFVKGDGFKYEPDEPVDWLLSDVIAFPDRIADLLTKWLSHRLCRYFCVTVKFRGREDYPKLETIKQILVENSADFCLRRLNSNKNEVTVFGECS